jgi:hypothetical protein
MGFKGTSRAKTALQGLRFHRSPKLQWLKMHFYGSSRALQGQKQHFKGCSMVFKGTSRVVQGLKMHFKGREPAGDWRVQWSSKVFKGRKPLPFIILCPSWHRSLFPVEAAQDHQQHRVILSGQHGFRG